MGDIKITDEIRAILDQCEFTPTTIKLPEGQLDRKLYVQINAILEEAGGKWSKKLKLHAFPSNPKEKLGLIVEGGVLVDSKKLFQSYFTPSDVAKRVVEIADVENCVCLEPSAGGGALIDEMLTYDGVEILAVELNEEFAKELDNKYGMRVGLIHKDFLEVSPQAVYDRAVLNPPFNKNQWISHIEHAYKFLKPSGKLVAITPNSLQNARFQKFVVDKKWEFEEVEAGAFKESGTNIATNIVTIWK